MIIVNFLLWLYLWIVIYFAHRTYPIASPFEDWHVSQMRDLIACKHIISADDILTAKDLSLFLKILQILDFLYFTVLPALLTCASMYILRYLIYG